MKQNFYSECLSLFIILSSSSVRQSFRGKRNKETKKEISYYASPCTFNDKIFQYKHLKGKGTERSLLICPTICFYEVDCN